ncbi:hypothetical protein WDW37_05345 [Bdellovibrionota bacterium FG-1]
MKNNRATYYAHRTRLEKLKFKSWRLFVLAKILVFLVKTIADYLGQI